MISYVNLFTSDSFGIFSRKRSYIFLYTMMVNFFYWIKNFNWHLIFYYLHVVIFWCMFYWGKKVEYSLWGEKMEEMDDGAESCKVRCDMAYENLNVVQWIAKWRKWELLQIVFHASKSSSAFEHSNSYYFFSQQKKITHVLLHGSSKQNSSKISPNSCRWESN